MRLKRYTPLQKIFHILLITTFLILSVTGVSLMYHSTDWGRSIAILFGGYSGTLQVHIITGIIMIAVFVIHVIYAFYILLNNKIHPGDSVLPQIKDFKQLFEHIRWVFGGKFPDFDRWSYAEKFEYWAVLWGTIVLAITGLILAVPEWSTRYIEGWGLNIALWIHRIEAGLAMLDIFLVHYLIVHMRRQIFPMDRTMLSGDADYKVIAHEKPAWIKRLKASGDLDIKLVEDTAPAWKKVVSYTFGLTAVAIGFYLVIGALLNLGAVVW